MLYRSIIAGLLVASSLAAGQALAQDAASIASDAAEGFGPEVGATAPALSVFDSEGQARTLGSLYGENGVIIYFNRSLDWCPICQRQTLEIDAEVERFNTRGYEVAVLTYDSVETLARFDLRRKVDIVLLSDEGSVTIDAFDVRDPVYAEPDSFAHGVPYPVAFVIGADGVVQAKFWHEAGLGDARGYAARVTVEDVLAELDALSD
ncbi:MAG: redoxin domain-containing protein [Pseudomonadota bacterium]